MALPGNLSSDYRLSLLFHSVILLDACLYTRVPVFLPRYLSSNLGTRLSAELSAFLPGYLSLYAKQSRSSPPVEDDIYRYSVLMLL